MGNNLLLEYEAGLDPFYLTSKAVETGLIEDNILTRAHEIAAIV